MIESVSYLKEVVRKVVKHHAWVRKHAVENDDPVNPVELSEVSPVELVFFVNSNLLVVFLDFVDRVVVHDHCQRKRKRYEQHNDAEHESESERRVFCKRRHCIAWRWLATPRNALHNTECKRQFFAHEPLRDECRLTYAEYVNKSADHCDDERPVVSLVVGTHEASYHEDRLSGRQQRQDDHDGDVEADPIDQDATDERQYDVKVKMIEYSWLYLNVCSESALCVTLR